MIDGIKGNQLRTRLDMRFSSCIIAWPCVGLGVYIQRNIIIPGSKPTPLMVQLVVRLM